MRTKKLFTIIITVLLSGGTVCAQSVEYYAGNQRNGIDLMWFKYFKKVDQTPSHFLFFSRNRASVDYHNSPTLMASTNAVSYNFSSGVAVVAVASFQSIGFTPKAGIQYYKKHQNFMFFGWLVADIKAKGGMDLFGLFKYQPKLEGDWRGFVLLELFPVYQLHQETWNLTQRIRLGAQYHEIAGGFMADLNQSGQRVLTSTHNIGGFLRYDF